MEHEFIERRTATCDTHQRNTTAIDTAVVKIAGIEASMYTGRWIFGIILSIVVIIIGATLSDIKSGIAEVKSDIKTLIPTEARLDRLEKTVDYNSNRLLDLEKFRHDHK